MGPSTPTVPATRANFWGTLTSTPDGGAADALATIQLLMNAGVPSGTYQYFANSTVPKLSRASDIYHSVPVIVDTAAQSKNWPDPTETAAYLAFSTNNQTRARNIYIGANDGMLHALTDSHDADGGVERWGYVPQALLPQLSGMRNGHVFGVDGSMAVADVCFSTGCTDSTGNGWVTFLSAPSGRGVTRCSRLTSPTPRPPTTCGRT